MVATLHGGSQITLRKTCVRWMPEADGERRAVADDMLLLTIDRACERVCKACQAYPRPAPKPPSPLVIAPYTLSYRCPRPGDDGPQCAKGFGLVVESFTRAT